MYPPCSRKQVESWSSLSCGWLQRSLYALFSTFLPSAYGSPVAEHEKQRQRNAELVALQEEAGRRQEEERRQIAEQIEAERRATEKYKVCRRSAWNWRGKGVATAEKDATGGMGVPALRRGLMGEGEDRGGLGRGQSHSAVRCC